MLSKDQIKFYHENGYVICPDFWSKPEISLLQEALENLVAEGKLRNVATDDDGETHSNAKKNLQICPASPHAEAIAMMPFAKRIRETVHELLGQDFLLQLDQIFLKPGGDGAGTNWHQDNSYFKIPDPTAGVGMWTALHDAHIENGTMHVVPKSHDHMREHYRDLGSDHHIRCDVADDEEQVAAIMPAGGAIFFNYGIVHCTLANKTDKPRAGLALHFLSSQYEEMLSNVGKACRPYLSGPKYSKGQNEYGKDCEKAWEDLQKVTV